MARRSDHTREELTRLALDAARRITERSGLRELRARQIVRDIGYTIGTLYNLFDDLDDLIVHMNGETLDALFEACANRSSSEGTEAELTALAVRYLEFTRSHPKLWNAVFEHTLPAGRERPDWYGEKVAGLLDLEQRALAPLLSVGQQAHLGHHTRVLWTSLFGMAAVESSGGLPEGETADSLVRSLIEIYVIGLRQKARDEGVQKPAV
jgi:AcrR family transcriptional regulator